MTRLPLSVFIITKNEEERLPQAIASVIDWVDEVVVIDSGSTDKTVEIASNAGCKVLFNTWRGYGPQKVFGETQCRHDWLLNIDADEEVSPELRDAIITLFAKGAPTGYHGFTIFRELVFLGQTKPSRFAVGDHAVRLYDRRHAGFSDSTVHDSVIMKEPSKTGVIKRAFLYHRCFRSLEHWAGKINYYSTLQAEDWVAKNRPAPYLRVIAEPFTAFLKSYVYRRYFLYGLDGFIASMLYAHARMLRLAKVRELYRLKRDQAA